jgi:O-antigen/teichoic acid export membrane protein
MRGRFLALGAWSFCAQAARLGLNLAVFLIVARWVDLAELGAYGMAFAVVQMLQAAVRSGVPEVVIARVEPGRPFLDAAFLLVVGLGLLLSAASLAASLALPLVLGDTAARNYLIVLAVLPLVEALGAVPEALLRRSLRIEVLALRTLAALAIAAAVALTAAAYGAGVWSLAAFAIIGTTLSSLIAIVMAGWRPTGWGRAAEFHELLPAASRICLAGLAGGLITPVLQLVAGAMFGATMAGAYAIALRVLNFMAAMTIEPLRYVALPMLARLESGPARNAGAVELLRHLAIAVTPVYVAVFVAADSILSLAAGANGRAAAPLVVALGWNFLHSIVALVLVQCLILAGRSVDQMIYSVVQALAGLGSSLVAGLFSGLALAWTNSARVHAVLPMLLWYAARWCGLRASTVLLTVAPAFVLGVVSFLLGEVVEDRLRHGNWPAPAAEPVAAAAAVLFYAVGVLLWLLRAAGILRTPASVRLWRV